MKIKNSEGHAKTSFYYSAIVFIIAFISFIISTYTLNSLYITFTIMFICFTIASMIHFYQASESILMNIENEIIITYCHIGRKTGQMRFSKNDSLIQIIKNKSYYLDITDFKSKGIQYRFVTEIEKKIYNVLYRMVKKKCKNINVFEDAFIQIEYSKKFPYEISYKNIRQLTQKRISTIQKKVIINSDKNIETEFLIKNYFGGHCVRFDLLNNGIAFHYGKDVFSLKEFSEERHFIETAIFSKNIA